MKPCLMPDAMSAKSRQCPSRRKALMQACAEVEAVVKCRLNEHVTLCRSATLVGRVLNCTSSRSTIIFKVGGLAKFEAQLNRVLPATLKL